MEKIIGLSVGCLDSVARMRGGGSTLQDPDPQLSSVKSLIHQRPVGGCHKVIQETQMMNEAETLRPGDGPVPFGGGEEAVPDFGGVHGSVSVA